MEVNQKQSRGTNVNEKGDTKLNVLPDWRRWEAQGSSTKNENEPNFKKLDKRVMFW